MLDACPTVGEDAAVQSAFPPTPVVQIMSRIVGVGFGLDASAHGFHRQLFHGDEIIFAYQHGGGFRHPIVLAIIYPTLDAPHGMEGAIAAFGSELGVPAATLLVRPVLPGELALQAPVLLRLLDGRLGDVEEQSIRRGERVRATPVQADRPPGVRPFDGKRRVGEHESPVRPVHGNARVLPDGLAYPNVYCEPPTGLVLTLTTILSRHTARDDDHTGTLARPMIQGVTGLRLVTPAHEILRSLMAGTEPRNLTAAGLLTFQSGEPTRVLHTFAGRENR